ncbi:PucR family transcriptional regulator [Streptomyces rubiginosohelvolus]|uniref:PucR family transcriptional regulator n=1 Tax=Streptomyces rubiginosohelvolus TaxID=67362 RepID=UPI0036A4DF69
MANRLHALAAKTFDATATAVCQEIVTRVPRASDLDQAVKDDTRYALGLGLEYSLQGQLIPASEMDFFRSLGQHRAEAGWSVEDVKVAYAAAWVAEVRTLLSHDDAAAIHAELDEFLATASSQAEALIEESKFGWAESHVGSGGHQARALLLQQLVEGASPTAVADVAGITLPQGYLVLLCQSGSPASAHRNSLSDDAVRILSAVPGLLWKIDPGGDLLMLLPSGTDASVSRVLAESLTESLRETLGCPLRSVEAHAGCLEDVPTAYDEVKQSIRLAVALPEVRTRPYKTEELLVEMAIAAQPALIERLTALLGPLSQGTDLHMTLETLFECGLDRERATCALFIHRRTLTYRIQRIRELTGIDPTSPHGIQLLRAALVATRLR